MDRIERLLLDVADLREGVAAHPVFAAAGGSLVALRLFVEHQVFAVWDFMSLLKSLQRRSRAATCPGSRAAAPRRGAS